LVPRFDREVFQRMETQYVARGTWVHTGDDGVTISELPVKKWTNDYKANLEGLMAGAEAEQEGEEGPRRRRGGEGGGG
jgi:hypothetical protein